MQPSLRRLFLSCIVAFLAIAPSAARASGPEVIVKVHPASGLVSTYFDLAAHPGTRVHPGTLELDNPTSQAVTVRLDPVDAVTTGTLGSAYGERGASIHGSTRWLGLSRGRVVIPPHGQADVDVTAAVPASAAPGDYLSGIAVEALNQQHPLHAAHGLAIGEVDRYAIGVELSLPGARSPRVRFTGARLARDPSGLMFYLLAGNPGNVILKNVHGWAWVTRGRRTIGYSTIAPGTFVSGTGIAYPVPARSEHPREGTVYRVRAVLYYAGGVARLDILVKFGHGAAVAQQQYGGPKLAGRGIPWWVWVIVAAAVVLLIAAFVRRRRRRNPVPESRAQALIARELAAARVPLSIIRIALRDAPAAARRGVARRLRRRLREADRFCDLGEHGLMVVLPETDATLADSFAWDLGGALTDDPRFDGIGTSTAFDHVDPLELIARASPNHGDASSPIES